MSSFTRFLAEQLGDPHLQEFIANWDGLEALMTRIYKQKQATPQDEAVYRKLREWLRQYYPRWRDRLAPYWQQVRVGGEPLRRDPFEALLGVPHAEHFVDNWKAMQTLPAARESLNQYLMDEVIPGQEGRPPPSPSSSQGQKTRPRRRRPLNRSGDNRR